MKPVKFDRDGLLEEIFAPTAAEAPASTSADAILRVIEVERKKRRWRRQATGLSAALVIAAAMSLPFIFSRPARSGNSAAKAPTAIPAVPAPVAPKTSPPQIHRVDDEQMLAMLNDQPAALVRWPDGRQTLLLVGTPK